jgi:menaquinone-specific isochorismate synthase
LGLGSAHGWSSGGTGRFAELEARLEGLRQGWHHADPDGTGLEPLAFVGFAYGPEDRAEGFPNLELRVPELLLARRGDSSTVTLTWRTEENEPLLALSRAAAWVSGLARGSAGNPHLSLERVAAMPSDEIWLARIRQAVADIRGGRLDKVVLSRRVRFRAPESIGFPALIPACQSRFPECTVFAWSHPGGMLLGASPERLLALRGRQVVSDAIAGTAARAASAAEDGRLEVGLRTSGKIGQEHHPVVTSIARQLLPVCESLDLPDQPRVLKLANAQHLWSAIAGRLKPGVGIAEVLARLHPTPAVGGAPRQTALAWQSRHGELRAAWYAGAVGWIARDGDGEFSVVLRSAWISGNSVDLFAGAGIVAESDPDAELGETELKLGAMLDILDQAHDAEPARRRRG